MGGAETIKTPPKKMPPAGGGDKNGGAVPGGTPPGGNVNNEPPIGNLQINNDPVNPIAGPLPNPTPGLGIIPPAAPVIPNNLNQRSPF